MAINRTGKSAVVPSSVLLQLLLYLTAFYFSFYFLSTLCIIIYKSRVLSYPDDLLGQDVSLLFVMAGLELLRLFCGMKGNLQEKEGYLWASLAVTVVTALLSVYYLVWQPYVMRADIILNESTPEIDVLSSCSDYLLHCQNITKTRWMDSVTIPENSGRITEMMVLVVIPFSMEHSELDN
ncbi:transmembrane protein 80 isoform X1 [Esox lucius]|nr:transmembrane protein 80 isoform X1 [Esox lucius]